MSLRLATKLRPAAPSSARTFVTRPKHTIKDPLTSASNAEISEVAPGLTFIRRPPPTAESPLSLTTNPTSPLLRPKTSLSDGSLTRTISLGQSSRLPPTVRRSSPRVAGSESQGPPSLTKAQIDEIKALREEDPIKNTVAALAERYQCSRVFIQMVAPTKKISTTVKTAEGLVQMSEAERQQMLLERKKERWGERKRTSREVRKIRRSLW